MVNWKLVNRLEALNPSLQVYSEYSIAEIGTVTIRKITEPPLGFRRLLYLTAQRDKPSKLTKPRFSNSELRHLARNFYENCPGWRSLTTGPVRRPPVVSPGHPFFTSYGSIFAVWTTFFHI